MSAILGFFISVLFIFLAKLFRYGAYLVLGYGLYLVIDAHSDDGGLVWPYTVIVFGFLVSAVAIAFEISARKRY